MSEFDQHEGAEAGVADAASQTGDTAASGSPEASGSAEPETGTANAEHDAQNEGGQEKLAPSESDPIRALSITVYDHGSLRYSHQRQVEAYAILFHRPLSIDDCAAVTAETLREVGEQCGGVGVFAVPGRCSVSVVPTTRDDDYDVLGALQLAFGPIITLSGRGTVMQHRHTTEISLRVCGWGESTPADDMREFMGRLLALPGIVAGSNNMDGTFDLTHRKEHLPMVAGLPGMFADLAGIEVTLTLLDGHTHDHTAPGIQLVSGRELIQALLTPHTH